jgi:uncharacterized membrane protein YfcA
MDLTLLLATAFVFLLAGTLKGVIGLGLPALGIGLATLFLDPRTAVALLIVPILVSNIWQLWRIGGAWGALRRYWIFAVVLMAGIWVSAGYAARAPEAVLRGVTGLAFLLYAVTNLVSAPPPLPDRWDRAAQGLFGMVAGVLGGLTALWGPPTAIYLSARGAERDEFVRGTGLLFFLGTLPLLGGYARAGLFSGPEALLSAAMVLPVLAGFSLGERLRHRIPAARFRTLTMWMFIALGLNLIRRAFMG